MSPNRCSVILSLLSSCSRMLTRLRCDARLVDTLILINSFISYPLLGPGSGAVDDGQPLDPRSALAIARMNYFHHKYKTQIVRRFALIIPDSQLTQVIQSNDDLLYTLATFLLGPIEWMGQYEWRQLTPLEEQVRRHRSASSNQLDRAVSMSYHLPFIDADDLRECNRLRSSSGARSVDAWALPVFPRNCKR